MTKKTKPVKKIVRVPERTATVAFEGDYAELEATVRVNIPIRQALHLEELAQAANNDAERGSELLTEFGERVLVDWNLGDDDGNPLPPTGEGMLEIPVDFARELIQRAMSLLTGGVESPLEQQSPSGDTSAGAMTGRLANSSRSLES